MTFILEMSFRSLRQPSFKITLLLKITLLMDVTRLNKIENTTKSPVIELF